LKVSILNNLIMAKIQLNGRKLILKNKCSIFGLLKKYGIDRSKIAVELNTKIINRNKFKSIFVKDKDKIEVVHFIGGG
jgi:sulfur carrier protein